MFRSQNPNGQKKRSPGRFREIYTSRFVSIRVGGRANLRDLFTPIITVSKKQIPTAVKRNLLKRRYRNIFRTRFSTHTPEYSIQCIIKKEAVSASFQDLKKDIELAFKP